MGILGFTGRDAIDGRGTLMFRFNRKGWVAVIAGVVIAATIAGCGGASSGAGKYPSGPVEFVVPFKPGGGSDNMARMITSIFEQEKLVSQPVSIVNKDGGAGAVGMNYAAAKKADTHTLLTTIDAAVSVPLQPDYKGMTIKDLTVIATLAMDDFLVVVPANSPHKTIEELIAFAKANPGKLKLATASAGGEDHVFGSMIEKATGAKFTYVHTKGGSEAMQEVVGSHVDIAVPNPSETLSQLEGKLVRALAVGSAKRLEILKDIPTLKEKSINVEFQMFRAVSMPAGVPQDVVKYWENVFKKATETERWKKDYLMKFGLTPNFKTGKDALDIVMKTEANYRTALKDLGIIK